MKYDLQCVCMAWGGGDEIGELLSLLDYSFCNGVHYNEIRYTQYSEISVGSQ